MTLQSSKAKRVKSEDSSEDDHEEADISQKTTDEEDQENTVQMPLKDSEGGVYFNLSKCRRVTLRKWQDKLLLDIREFYNDKATGVEKPGKKGISLSMDQFQKLKTLIPSIESQILRMN